MTEKEMEQQMLDEINKYKPLIAAIGCCDIAKKYAHQEVKKLIIPVVSGWRSFSDEKPLDDQRYYYSQGNQFFKGVWSDKLKGFLLDGCNNKYISSTCDYFHACP